MDGAQLAEALAAVQAEATKLSRNAIGQIGARTYGYVTLDAIVDEVLPLLDQHQLLWRAFPTVDEAGAPALRYRITHVPSGESDEDVMPLLGCTDSQALGSAITYARRYALTAVLNLTVDPEDDGAAASAHAVDRYAEAAQAHAELAGEGKEAPQPTAEPAKPTERRITANQRTKLLIPRAKKAKLTEAQFANVILAAAGDEPRTWSTPEHAADTLKRLLDHLPARLKDAVLDGIDQASVANTAGKGKR